ncbi:unnamed protein product [Phyllotreta striolata]|uniref:Uncharacterized protein n=1 Tax=Phyllotreta striolata TaxID=444603 RepID=A0A9N9XUV2_PHYSR|nr:unnamed protein product [Phyllotreta striolata]
MNSSTALWMVFLTVLSTAEALVTNEDIRTAILQMVNVVRSTDDKLERHEYRDRIVGEQLKKGMINIDKRIKMLDPLKGTVGRLDERLAAVETILMQKNEREKMQLQRTYEAVIDIQKNLPVIMEELKNDIIAKVSTHEPPAQIIEPVISKKDFEKLEKEVVSKIDRVSNTISKLESELSKMKNDSKQMKDLHNKSSDNLEKLKRHISDNQQLLSKYDKKLSEYNNKIPEIAKIQSKDADEWKRDMLESLAGQKTGVKEVLTHLNELSSKVDRLPQKVDSSLGVIRNIVSDNLNATYDNLTNELNGILNAVTNTRFAIDGQNTNVMEVLQNVRNIRIDKLPSKEDLSIAQRDILRKLDEARISPAIDEIRRLLYNIDNKTSHSGDYSGTVLSNIQAQISSLPQKHDLASVENSTLAKLEPLAREIRLAGETSKKNHEDTSRNLNDLSEIIRSIADSFATNIKKMRTDVQALTKVDQVMIKTADDVLDTKRRLEYGVHQILDELAKQIKKSAEHINQGLSDRFDLFEASILDEDTGALANLTSKIGEDIHQVWRQIGIMYQQISSSSDTLNHLQNITDSYVNGSLGAMDSMKGKVGQINGRMTEVDENLNYLLGRLSLVTQEFNRIKTGLGTALDQIRDSFHTVQSKIENTGPGPHKISSIEAATYK